MIRLVSLQTDLALYRDRPVLVTGAAGFIGRQVCETLAKLGARVHAAVRSDATLPDGVTVHRLDVADADAVDRLINTASPEYVFHLASRVSGSRELDEVGPTFYSNLASTVNLLRAVTGTHCRRIVLAGSLEEARDDVPSSPYAAAKSAASMYARMFHRLYGTPITIARLFMVYGPGQNDARKLVPYVSLSLLSGKAPQLSSGVRPVDWVYIDDVVHALLSLAINPNTNGQTIDIGTGQLTTVRSVAERIGQLVGTQRGPVFGAIDDRAAEEVRRADPTTAADLMGHPFTDLDTGLRQTVAWYRERLQQGELSEPQPQ
jgi:UDP-glucose 4-epimerase